MGLRAHKEVPPDRALLQLSFRRVPSPRQTHTPLPSKRFCCEEKCDFFTGNIFSGHNWASPVPRSKSLSPAVGRSLRMTNL